MSWWEAFKRKVRRVARKVNPVRGAQAVAGLAESGADLLEDATDALARSTSGVPVLSTVTEGLDNVADVVEGGAHWVEGSVGASAGVVENLVSLDPERALDRFGEDLYTGAVEAETSLRDVSWLDDTSSTDPDPNLESKVERALWPT